MFHVKQFIQLPAKQIQNVPRETFLKMEFLVQCPLCGAGEEPSHFLECADYLMGSGSYSMVKCKLCHHVYTNPRPFENDLGVFYQSQEYISHKEKGSSFRERIYFRVQAYMLKRKARLINTLKLPKPKLLDVGCGAGAFLSQMKNHDLQIVGIEPNATARLKAQKKDMHVIENQNHIPTNEESSFGIITLWHVLEHQADFMQSLQLYHRLLAPGGWLVIAVPLYLGFDAWFYGKYWAAYDLPRHLHHFSPKTLKLATQNCGFEFRGSFGMFFDAFYVAMLSENNKGKRLGAFRAIWVAAWSNLLAALKLRPWSSQIMVFQKST